jgi:hypothetical protein
MNYIPIKVYKDYGDHFCRELDPCRKLTLLEPDDTRRVGKPKLRWLESDEEDLKNKSVRNWRMKLAGPQTREHNFGRG